MSDINDIVTKRNLKVVCTGLACHTRLRSFLSIPKRSKIIGFDSGVRSLISPVLLDSGDKDICVQAQCPNAKMMICQVSTAYEQISARRPQPAALSFVTSSQ